MSNSLQVDDICSRSPWDVADDEKFFTQLLSVSLFVGLILTFVILYIELPEVEKKIYVPDAPQLVQLLLDRVEAKILPEIIKPEPEPKPKPKQVPKQPMSVEPVPVNNILPAKQPSVAQEVVAKKALPEKKIAPLVETIVPQTVKQAEQKAQLSGLLAFKDDFAAMREKIDISRLSETVSIQPAPGERPLQQREVSIAKTAGRQATINIAELSTDTIDVALVERSTTKVEASVPSAVPLARPLAGTGTTLQPRTTSEDQRSGLIAETKSYERSIESVRKVFDLNKGAIYALYKRALRTNPGLFGKVVLELVILPDGRVSEIKVISTDMADANMMEKLVNRIRLFDFGVSHDAITRISYPVHFLPG
ncbi:MAG: AgmX/PglI C-terminal domain-containing protein [Pseudomonadales bacterium]|nr:AgmX/PglI C-terminal domain-containing protein [Pseudomonadales bacterium]